MKIDDLIKEEMTPKTIKHHGQEIHNHTPVLIDYIHGDGQCLIYVVPLATRPNYYIMRVDTSVRKMIEEDEDEICDVMDAEFYGIIEDECGPYYWENDDGDEVEEPWPALNLTCGCDWGEITG